MKQAASRFFTHYGMAVVLLMIGLYYSWATYQPQQPHGDAAAQSLAAEILRTGDQSKTILIVARPGDEDRKFADGLERRLKAGGLTVAAKVLGEPRDAKKTLRELEEKQVTIGIVATTSDCATWGVFDEIKDRVQSPQSYHWPTFLKVENLLNVANQTVIVAIIAIGMTMVIITGGIDLSVGSLIALSAVVAGILLRDVAGGTAATPTAMILCSAAGIALCAAIGAFTGTMVTVFRVPPFIASLAVMLIASGLAYKIANDHSISEIPDAYIWLGRGVGFFAIPHAVVLMALIYVAAHILMSRTTLGRYIYAVGGNVEAARLSGVRVGMILLFVYVISGATAGLGGIVMASQLKSASPTYGLMYELYVIAAVVVGGTSLAGGEGKIFGTLIGAFIIAVINNGMNLTGVESQTQKIVLGVVILVAVLLDMLKRRGWRQYFARLLKTQTQQDKT